MYKKITLLAALASFLTVGCATTQSSDAVAVPEKPVIAAAVMTPATKTTKPTSYSQPMVKLSPAQSIGNADRKAILACIDLIKPEVVRPTTIKPDIAKTKITRTANGDTTVKMPFTVLNGFGEDEPILATCVFNKLNAGSVTLADI